MERKIEEKILWIDSSNQELFYSLDGTTTYTASTNNFYYNIGNILYVDNYKKLSVELIDCAISKNLININVDIQYPLPFNASTLKIYINFGIAVNTFSYGTIYDPTGTIISSGGNNILMGLIQGNSLGAKMGLTTYSLQNFYYSDKSCEKLIDNKIKYYLKDIPSGIINIYICDPNNETLYDVNGNEPTNTLLCLKFTYEF